MVLAAAAAGVCGIVAALAAMRIHRSRQTALPKLSNEHAGYFQDLYDDARKMFRAAAQRAKAELHVLPLEGPCWGGKNGDPCAFKGEDRLLSVDKEGNAALQLEMQRGQWLPLVSFAYNSQIGEVLTNRFAVGEGGGMAEL